MSDTAARRSTPPFFFFVLELPFACAVGLLQIAVPFWLAKQGVPLSEIAQLSATASIPHSSKVFWVPLLDIGNYRRRWYLVMTLLTAGFLAACGRVAEPEKHLELYTLLLAGAQTTAATAASALNALMALTSRPEDKGRVGGWQMAGNVGGTGLFGTLPIWVASQFGAAGGDAGMGAACSSLAVITLLSGALALTITEPDAAEAAAEKARSFLHEAWARFAAILKDLWALVKSREGFTGLVICAAPVGCGALTNLFSAMAADFHADEHTVEMVNGVWGGLVSAAGSIAGGFLADRMNRRVAYCLSGGLTALSAFAMAAAPLTPATYSWGVLAYNFANGVAFAAFAGMVLEMVSHGAAVTTKYALFVAISNYAINYVTVLDGKASEWRRGGGLPWGTTGTIAFDGVITLLGIAVLAALALLLRRPPAPAPVPAAQLDGP